MGRWMRMLTADIGSKGGICVCGVVALFPQLGFYLEIKRDGRLMLRN